MFKIVSKVTDKNGKLTSVTFESKGGTNLLKFTGDERFVKDCCFNKDGSQKTDDELIEAANQVERKLVEQMEKFRKNTIFGLGFFDEPVFSKRLKEALDIFKPDYDEEMSNVYDKDGKQLTIREARDLLNN